VPAFPLAAATVGTPDELAPFLRTVRALLEQERARQAALTPEPEPVIVPAQVEELRIDRLRGGGYRVHNRRAERAVAMTDMASEEALDRLQELLRRFGVTRALEGAGVVDGDTVFIGDAELIWGNVPELEPIRRRLTRRERQARRDAEREAAQD
jgi:Obg family GTPase CgtA-like protein